MKFIREFMLGRYKQYIADQKRLLDLEAKAVEDEKALGAYNELLVDLGRFHAAMRALQRSEVSEGYSEAVGDVCAVFVAVVGEHLRE